MILTQCLEADDAIQLPHKSKYQQMTYKQDHWNEMKS